MTNTITLTEAETAAWESDDSSEAEEFRRSVRARGLPGHVEVYSHDGIVLDTWDAETFRCVSPEYDPIGDEPYTRESFAAMVLDCFGVSDVPDVDSDGSVILVPWVERDCSENFSPWRTGYREAVLELLGQRLQHADALVLAIDEVGLGGRRRRRGRP